MISSMNIRAPGLALIACGLLCVTLTGQPIASMKSQAATSKTQERQPRRPTAVDSVMNQVLGLGDSESTARSVTSESVFADSSDGAEDVPGEIRGLWVVRHALSTERGVRDVVKAARENGFNALFVQVRGRGETYYRSRIDPIARCLVPDVEAKPIEEKSSEDDVPVIDLRRNKPPAAAEEEPPIEMTFDPLKLLVDLAHLDGLKVHAWINAFFTWSENEPHPSEKHVINRHPDWITTDANGVRLDYLSPDQLKARWIEGLYLSPARPEVRKYLIDVVCEIATAYKVDGIHLDYVRYPGRGCGIDEHSRELFAKEHDFDLEGLLPGADRARVPIDSFWSKDLMGLWEDWRAEQVTSLVSELSWEIRSRYPGIVLSAAVKPDPVTALSNYGQDWTSWLKLGYIDLAAPMLYLSSTPDFFEGVTSIKEDLPEYMANKVLAGIALFRQSPRRCCEKIDVARAAGLGGFVLFSYNSAIRWKKGEYLPAIKAKVMGPDAIDRTALEGE